MKFVTGSSYTSVRAAQYTLPPPRAQPTRTFIFYILCYSWTTRNGQLQILRRVRFFSLLTGPLSFRKLPRRPRAAHPGVDTVRDLHDPGPPLPRANLYVCSKGTTRLPLGDRIGRELRHRLDDNDHLGWCVQRGRQAASVRA